MNRENMQQRSIMVDDPLEDFTPRSMTFDNRTKKVYMSGSGPAAIVLPEIPGISPAVSRLARWVRDAGFTVFIPSLYGRDGAVPLWDEGEEVFKRACVSAEFNTMVSGRSSPISSWLRALARAAHAECGGPGVGAIGLCFTGNFALSMMLEPAMLAPVLSEPALPLKEPGGLEISAEELQAVSTRMEREGLVALAYRFRGDPFCTAARFAAYEKVLGTRFRSRVIDDEHGNREVSEFYAKFTPTPHCVLTQHLIDKEGEPTSAAREEVLNFFRERLLPGGAASA
jgi:dienelactone hydrolase